MLVACLVGSALVSVARAADFDDGVIAFRARDYATAQASWQKSAAAGDARGEYGLGYLSEYGLGTAANYQQAFDWYGKAAALKNGDALYAMGRMYESGEAGARNLSQALAEYQAAANAGSADGAFAAGRMLTRGQGAKADVGAAIPWLLKAAQGGEPAAQYLLAEAYESGWSGKESDPVQAYVWYSRAASGDAEVLKEADPAFQPKQVLGLLRRRMSREQLEAAQAELKVRAAPPKPSSTKAS